MSGVGVHTSLEPEEPRQTPLLSVVFGTLPMVPFVLAAGLALAAERQVLPLLVRGTVLWGAAILSFLAGVRRGLSFRTAGGARVAEMASMLWVFTLAAAASMLAWWPDVDLLLLIVGYASVGWFDHLAARHGEAPPFFARMRPLQMAAPVLCLMVVALRAWE